MPNARFAEFLLRRATTPDRASAITGDLLEQFPHRPLRFAIALARVLLGLQWKQILAFAAALFAFIFPAFAFAKVALHYLTPAIERHERFKTTTGASPLLVACMGLLAVCALALARPSTRRVAVLSLALAITTFLAACSIFLHPAWGRNILATVFALALFLIAIPALRTAALITFGATIATCLTMFVLLGLILDLLHPHGKYIVNYDLGFSAFAWISGITMGAFTLNALQRRFAPTPPPVIS